MQENMTYFFIICAVVVALAALAALVNYVISIVHGFRRDPPLPEDAPQLGHHVVAGPVLGLVDDDDAVSHSAPS